MAITKIGTKLIADLAVTTTKLSSSIPKVQTLIASSIKRNKIQSGSVQPGHMDLSLTGAGQNHVDILDDDMFIFGDKTKFDANNNPQAGTHVRTFKFSSLKTALSLSNAARGEVGTVQFKATSAPFGFDGVASLLSDGTNLTMSNGGKVHFSAVGASGSHGSIFSDAVKSLTIEGDTQINLHSSASVQGHQAQSVVLETGSLRPITRPAVAVQPGTYKFQFTSGSIGRNRIDSSGGLKTYGPLSNGNAQMISVLSTGSGASLGKEWYLFYLNEAASASPLPVSASLNLQYNDAGLPKRRHDIPVEAHSGITDWRDVVANLRAAMHTELNTNADLATVTLSTAANINATASITVTYKAGTMQGGIVVGTGVQGIGTAGSAFGRGTAIQGHGSPFASTPPSTQPAPIEGQFTQTNHDNKRAGEPDTSGGEVIVVSSGSAAIAADSVWLDLGGSSNQFRNVKATAFSGSGTDSSNAETFIHRISVSGAADSKITVARIRLEQGSKILSASAATFNTFDGHNAAGVAVMSFTNVRDAVSAPLGASDKPMLTASHVNSAYHKITASVGFIDRLSFGPTLTASAFGQKKEGSNFHEHGGIVLSSSMTQVKGNRDVRIASGNAISASIGDIFTLVGQGGGTYVATIASIAGNKLHFNTVNAIGAATAPYTLAKIEKVSTLHKVDADKGTIDRIHVNSVVTGSGLSTPRFLRTETSGVFGRIVYGDYRVTGGLTPANGMDVEAKLHNATTRNLSASVGKFQHMNVGGPVIARRFTSNNTTTEHFESVADQIIVAVSASSTTADIVGAGLQIGGTAGSGSTGIASILLGDINRNEAGKILNFNLGSTRAFSISGSNPALVRLGVTGTLSASIGVFNTLEMATAMSSSIVSGSKLDFQILSASAVSVHEIKGNRLNEPAVGASDLVISGSTFTYQSVSGSDLAAHTLDVKRATRIDTISAAGVTSTMQYHSITGSTLQATLLTGNKIGNASHGNATVTSLSASKGQFVNVNVRTVTSSASSIQFHTADTDKMTVSEIVSTDVIKSQHLNNDIVTNASDAHGGIVFANGKLSIGWKRRIFSRSSKKITNRSQPTQGTGSLYTTCSLLETQVVSGSERVFFNGLQLIPSDNNRFDGKGDYAIDHSHGGGLSPGVYKFQFTSGSIGRNRIDSSGGLKTYGPLSNGNAQMISVLSTGSGASLNKEWYLFYLNEAASPSPLPVSASLNLQYNDAGLPKRRHDIPVEAHSGITDWRDVVANLRTAMNTELNTNADLATVTLSTAANINATASITVTYKAGTMVGGIVVGTGVQGIGPAGSAFGRGTSVQGLGSPFASTPPSTQPAPIEGQFQQANHDVKRAGEPDTGGGEVIVTTSGSITKAGTGIFLSPNLAMDTDDVLVVQYLSGSHQF